MNCAPRCNVPVFARCLVVIAAAFDVIGCASSESPVAPSRTTAVSAPTTEAPRAIDATELLDRAIAAFGGPEARRLLRHGYVNMKIDGEFPGLSEQFGAQSVMFDAHFDLPDFERRDIYADANGEHLLIISNSGILWAGDGSGKGTQLPTPPASAYRGPLLVCII